MTAAHGANNVETERVLVAGQPDYDRCDNKVVSARYTPFNFFPIAITEQFRRFANVYFLVIGGIMFVGQYTPLFDTAISPWTTLGPLALVISISLAVEGFSDYKRHQNDHATNNAPVTVLQRVQEADADAERDQAVNRGNDIMIPSVVGGATVQESAKANTNGPTVQKVGFFTMQRKDVRQGHFVLVKNRETVPADLILLASSNEQGAAYIETSSIDGETNLKLRSSPRMSNVTSNKETMTDATRRLARISYLGNPAGKSVLMHPSFLETLAEESCNDTTGQGEEAEEEDWGYRPNEKQRSFKIKKRRKKKKHSGAGYVAALTSETPNASVHTFSGKISFVTSRDSLENIPLGADNMLLRGAVIRNTEWILGLSCFTGTDTKLVRNSFETPSKFSQLDMLINKTVVAILVVMILCIVYLASYAVAYNDAAFPYLYYAGFNANDQESWPFLPQFDPPVWQTRTPNWMQFFLMYVTLLNNFIPLSLYVSVEMVQFVLLWFVYSDLEMYDDTTNTRSVARSNIISDLGRIQYIFSDKTGTLTQNVMRFKRCSVDGIMFGSPIVRKRPGESEAPESTELTSPFHPLRQLRVGKFSSAPGSPEFSQGQATATGALLTFNSEMFLRVMCLCHTVVVEQDIDNKETVGGGTSTQLPPAKGILKGKGDKGPSSAACSATAKNVDGAPMGYAYQAESPDEWALVSVASIPFGFQVISRDSSGIHLSVEAPSHLQNTSFTDELRTGHANLESIAVETAHTLPNSSDGGGSAPGSVMVGSESHEETWTILAVNKFESDRKRMSILLRSPPELGNLPILFCKGADSAMLDSDVCGVKLQDEGGQLNSIGEEEDIEHSLRMQVHLGEFAREGLRTLVLGMRVLTEEQCDEWLTVYQKASTSMSDRDELLKQAAIQIERNLHVVGATAIEDRLQTNVPETIATLGKAGIKLWVLTGDKRETAVEIGYSTNVLTNKMHLTEVPDNGKEHVRTQMAMEFIRLVKIGRLKEYQKTALDGVDSQSMNFKQRLSAYLTELAFRFGKASNLISQYVHTLQALLFDLIGMEEKAKRKDALVKELRNIQKQTVRSIERRRLIRNVAENTVKAWLDSDEGRKHRRTPTHKNDDDEAALTSEDSPEVFLRAESANVVLQKRAHAGQLSQPEIRDLSLAHLTAHQVGAAGAGEAEAIVDEDTLSLNTFVPGGIGDKADFDKRKRTLLERMFAVDRDVRKGRLRKHMNAECLNAIAEDRETPAECAKKQDTANNRNAIRALVIEGAALKHLLGDHDFEEILFAVASNCDAVIACRVSPRQKAQLVNLVRQNIQPEPITLAIGDGANDVGMIQEAHVGIGISGKEGQQAVNASDFAIAQFRFLEPLVLIHGRWNFFRLSTVVLFSFYKNAVMAGVVICFTDRSIYSGTPLFDEWIMTMLNFVAAIPIIFLGIFDRCLSKEYVRKHPEVYAATRDNQLITIRSLARWIIACVGHVSLLYYCTVPQQSVGGGITPAYWGLMRNGNPDAPGDGEGGDLKSVGTVTFTSLIILLAYKVLFESRSLVHGRWPWCTFQSDVDGGLSSRCSYTWVGSIALSAGAFLGAISLYQLFGVPGANQFSGYTLTVNHVLGTRSLSWMIILFIPIIGMIFDVSAKLFSNIFYPTQTQIHLETEAVEKMYKRKQPQQ